MSTLAILGASGHGRVIAEVAFATKHYSRVVFFDDAWPDKKTNGNYEILGDSSRLKSFVLQEDASVFVAIGNNETRILKIKYFAEQGLRLVTLMHPNASVSSSAIVGAASIIMPGAVVNANVVIGDGAIVNTLSVVEHDCTLGVAVHISPGAVLAGGVCIGDYSWIGANATVIQQVEVGSNVIVGAGAVVIDNIHDNLTVAGVPAKVIRNEG